MRRTRKFAIPIAAAAISVTAWMGAVTGAAAETDDVGVLAAGDAAAAAIAANAADHDDPADHSWNSADVAAITLTGSSATSASSDVSVSGGVVTITGAGTYQLSGSLTNGQIVVNTTESGIVRLILNGVTIANSTSSAINVVDAGEVMVFLNAGTTNRLSDATSYVYPDASTDEPNAALFSTADLTIAGTGSLTVTGNAYDGITSKDGLVIAAGTITVTAVDEGIRGKDYLVVNGGTITVTTRAGDGLKSDEDGDATLGYVLLTNGTVNVTAAGDGVHGETDVITTGGTLTVRAGGGRTATLPADASAKGLKAGVLIVTGGGQITVDAADDALNSDIAIAIDGGTLTLATADDAVHGETTLDVTAGTINVTNSYEGLEALKLTISGGVVNVNSTDDGLNSAEEGVNEFAVAPNAFIRITGGSVATNGGTDAIDTNGTLTISGGTVAAHGSATRAGGEGGLDSNGPVTFTGGTTFATGLTAVTGTIANTSPQRWITYRFAATQAANSIVQVASGTTVIAAYRATKAFQQITLSSSQVIGGRSYNVYTGGSVSGTPVGGLYPGGSVTGATLAGTATATGTSVTTGPTSASPTTPGPAPTTVTPTTPGTTPVPPPAGSPTPSPASGPAGSRATSRSPTPARRPSTAGRCAGASPTGN
ncbi:carbohydrate-binding domain-containing protein [Phytohabitans rumicis]|uniref:Carbohydrate-binding domain-containing protein n=1 Tax=Phytohabitans rumicis TaxID=1076125 RepID=A0A6V8LI66_9ACTN|nr:carbohydrate-binding domain-containing protein [Phytohabitans rumicis]GFJ93836.1 hypothetical protein Prum_074780 [Phytohabitans rumicis]